MKYIELAIYFFSGMYFICSGDTQVGAILVCSGNILFAIRMNQ